MCKLYVDTYLPRYYPRLHKWPRAEHLERCAPSWRYRVRCHDTTITAGYQFERWDNAMRCGLKALIRVKVHCELHKVRPNLRSTERAAQ